MMYFARKVRSDATRRRFFTLRVKRREKSKLLGERKVRHDLYKAIGNLDRVLASKCDSAYVEVLTDKVDLHKLELKLVTGSTRRDY